MTDSQRDAYAALSESVLRQTAWFADCSAATLADIRGTAQVRALPRGPTLSRRGEPVASLCVVLDGLLEVSTTTRSGKRHIVGHLQAGQLMNLIPFIDEQGAIHDATAHTDAVVLLIGRDLFHRIMAAEPALTHRLMRL